VAGNQSTRSSSTAREERHILSPDYEVLRGAIRYDRASFHENVREKKNKRKNYKKSDFRSDLKKKAISQRNG
jgi:hypothetical protein